MSEEIFGPLLPIVKADYKSACELTQTLEHPLGLYIFSNDEKEINESTRLPLEFPLLLDTNDLLTIRPSSHQYSVWWCNNQRYLDARQCPEHPLRRRGWFRHWGVPRQIRFRHIYSQPYRRQNPVLVRVFSCLSLPTVQHQEYL